MHGGAKSFSERWGDDGLQSKTIMSSNGVGQTDYVSMYVVKRVRHFAGALWSQRLAW